MTKINPKYAIIAAGFQSSSLVHMPYYETEMSGLRSMHILGTGDAIIPHEMSTTLAKFFDEPVLVRHSGGHFLPAGAEQRPVYVETVRDWLLEHLEEQELRSSAAVEVEDNGGNDEEEEEDDVDLQDRVVRKTKKKQPRPPTSSDDSY